MTEYIHDGVYAQILSSKAPSTPRFQIPLSRPFKSGTGLGAFDPNIHHVSFSPIVEWDRVPYDTTWIPSGVGISADQGRKLGETGRDRPFMAEAQWPEAPFPLDGQ
jgi:hypothetical protein